MSRTFTVGPGSTYASLSAAYSAAVSSHTSPSADGQPWIFECEAFTDTTTPVTIDAATTASNGITIRPAIGDEHGGVLGAGYQLSSSTDFTEILVIDADYVTLRDISVIASGRSTAIAGLDNAGLEFYNVIARSGGQSGDIRAAFEVGNAVSTTPFPILINCLAYDSGKGFGYASFKRRDLYNCTAINCSDYGFLINTGGAAGACYMENCLAVDCSNADFDGTSGILVANNNASSDASAPGASSVTNVSSVTDYDATSYEPVASGALDGAGKNLSGTFTDDITGTTRSQWDIGAYAVAASDTTAPVLTSPTGTATGQTTATGTVSTDEGNGTLDAVVTESATTPSAAQIQAGQDHTGSAAVATDLNNTVSATGSQNVSFTGLTEGTTYYVHYVHQDAAGNDSTAVTSSSFTTTAIREGFTLPSSGVLYDGNADTQVADDTACTVLMWQSATLPSTAVAPDYVLTNVSLTSGTIEVDLSGEASPPTVGDVYSGFAYWTRADSSVPAFRFINVAVVDLDA